MTETEEQRRARNARQRLYRQRAKETESPEQTAIRREKERLRSIRRRIEDPEQHKRYHHEYYRRRREAAGFVALTWEERLEQAATKKALREAERLERAEAKRVAREADREAARWQREYQRQEKLRLAVLRDIEKQERKVKVALERKEKQAREVVKKQVVRPVVPGEDPDPVRAGVICTHCSIHMVTDGVYVWCDKCGREAA